MREFLWKGAQAAQLGRGGAKVAWNEVCRPKRAGRLGRPDLRNWNYATLANHLWHLLTNQVDPICVK